MTFRLVRPYLPVVLVAVLCLVMAVAVSPAPRRHSSQAGAVVVPLANVLIALTKAGMSREAGGFQSLPSTRHVSSRFFEMLRQTVEFGRALHCISRSHSAASQH